MIGLIQNVFVTGGAGYIGSHTCVELLNAGYAVTVYDNFSNSHPEALKRVERITNKKVQFINGDIRDENKLTECLRDRHYCGVIHFAGLKAVGESVARPLNYYDNNVQGTLCLLRAMQSSHVNRLVFSSSATVYGEPQHLPITESHPLSAINPYGRSKLFIEDILHDLFQADHNWAISILRYFNPVGAHPSGLIGEDPLDMPNNLMPIVAQVAVGRLPKLKIWGNDYPTPDGTGIRDYIHVCDLALGHLRALESLDVPKCAAVNLGTGKGSSVIEVINAFEKASGKHIAHEFYLRRQGDVAICYADTQLAAQLFNWRATRELSDMCEDAWRWQQSNPQGYQIK